MWQRFTEEARKVVFYALEESQKHGAEHVSTEHLLLGLLRVGEAVAIKVIEAMNVSVNRIRLEVEKQLPHTDARPSAEMTLTPRAKRVIDLAYHEASVHFHDNYIGTEHLLLGLVAEGDGIAGRALKKLGVEIDAARRQVIAVREGHPLPETKTEAKPVVPRPAPGGVTPPGDPWAKLVPALRRTIVLGELEALRRGQTVLSPEHLLLGLLREEENRATLSLVALGIELVALREAAAARCRDAGTPIRGEATLSAASDHAFKIAYQEQAMFLKAKVGTEHLLLGLLREPDGVAGRVLEEFAVEAEALREAIRGLDAEA